MIIQRSDGKTEFAYFRPSARCVCVVGDFNDWTPGRHVLQHDAHGWWRTVIVLRPGDYQFKYLVDQTLWEVDYAAFGVAGDGCGGWHSCLWVNECADPATPQRAPPNVQPRHESDCDLAGDQLPLASHEWTRRNLALTQRNTR